ncbi:CvpA family protein [Vagococcus coleopterorum]|uniref:CvpA family protein n=1 Tax=Vagococcus coleopterorum TaxID=2714946 RepID=A0A6G8APQ3_9ENTE|nr:CvpA family protein [Vagococcus coleopterorum]
MLTAIIILALALAFYNGARRGLVMQLILTAGYIITFVVAKTQSGNLAKKLDLVVPYPNPNAESKLEFFKGEALFHLDKAFYTILSFVLILIIGWLLTRFVGMLCNSLTFFPIVKQANFLGGGLISLLVSYIGIFFVLVMLATIPMDGIQNLLRSSGIAKFMINDTPYFSNMIFEWINQIMK